MKSPPIDLLVSAYMKGIFPMAHAELDGEVQWYAPNPRTILPLEGFHASRRLMQTVRQGVFEMRVNHAFDAVLDACAAPRGDGQGTWISPGLAQSYRALHRVGLAHSVEAWQGEVLVGGLYGVSLGGFFAGESMFHRATDASKFCLVHLVERLRARGYALLDVQFSTGHLQRFGAVDIARREYEARLAEALARACTFVDV